MMKINRCQNSYRSLDTENVEVIFGYPGGAVLPIYDELFKQKNKTYISASRARCCSCRRGYARSTGKVGAVLLPRPGATNTVTGLTDAMMDSICCLYFWTGSNTHDWE